MEQLANEWMRLVVTHAWQVTALIVLTAIVIRVFARNRPHLAFVLWLLVLVKCVTPPIWSSPSGLFSWVQPPRTAMVPEPPQLGGVVDREQHGFEPATVVARFGRSPVPIREWRDLTPHPHDLEGESLVATASASHPAPAHRVSPIEQIVVAVLVTWLSGAALIVVVAVFRYLGFWWHLNRQGCVDESRLADLVRDLSRRLMVKRNVRLRVSTGRVGPAVIGVLRPTVLLPSVLVEGRSDEELKPLLAHELIHVRRGDLWYGMLQVIAQALWWCHPLVWWAGRRTSREAERCCDEEVIAELGCSPARYARSLLGVLELKKTLKTAPAFPGVRPVEVTSNRLERIMKLGQGCRRRTPWWCWIVLVMAGAGMLPGAAFLAGEDQSPARILASPQGKHVASILPVPRNVPDEPLVTCVYEAADLIEKARLELGLDEEAAKKAVKYHPGVFGGPTPVAELEEADSRSSGKGPRAAWFDGKLIVCDTAARHDRISKALTALRKHGFGQVTIEARLVTGPEKVINAVGSNWTVMAAEVASNEKPTHEDPVDPTRAFRYFIGMHELQDLPSPGKAAKQRAQGQTVIEKRLPVMFAIMDDERASEVIEKLQGDAGVVTVSAPRVTTFNGQDALISSCSQRPFVVGVKDGKPQVRVVNEGFMMRLCPILVKNAKIRLELFLTLSTIRDVETTTIPAGKGQPETTLQVPVVAKTQLDMNVLAQSGSTVVIGGLKMTDKKGKEESVLVMLRPTALPLERADVPSGRRLSGVGVNSDAGVTGTIAIDPKITAANPSSDEKTPAEPPVTSPAPRPIVAAHSCKGIEPPSDDEVLRALGEQRKVNGTWLQDANRKDIRIVKEKIADYMDPPRTYPLIGPAQLHHTHYKCSIYFTETVRVGWPIPHETEKEAVEVVYIQTNHFHKLDDTRKKAATLEMHERLKQKVDVCFENAPLSEVLDEIGRKAELNIAIDEAGVHEEGVTVDEPVTIQLESAISVKSALNLILKPLALDYVIHEEVLKVTGEARMAARMYSKVYNVPDLVVPIPDSDNLLSSKGDGGTQFPGQDVAPDFDTIIELITSTIAPDSWEDVGGPGAIEAFPPNRSLVVSQTDDVHEQISNLLKQLRETVVDEGSNTLSTGTGEPINATAKPRRMPETSARHKGASNPSPYYLSDDVQYFAPGTEFTVGSKSQQPADETQKTKPAESSVLPAVKASKPSRKTANNQTNASSTNESTPIFAKVYNVPDLAVPFPDPDMTLSPKGEWGARPPRQDVAPDFDTIIELITSTIAPHSWEKVGGPGAVEAFPTNLSLVVSQTEQVHEEIVGLLEQLRRLRDVQVTLGLKAIRVSGDRDHPNTAWAEFMGESTIRGAAVDALQSVVSKSRWDGKSGVLKMTLFNGQKATVRFPRSDSEGTKRVGAFHFRPVASHDGESVRLSLEVEDLESPGEAREGATKVVPVGESLVVDLTGHLDGQQPGENSGERLLVVLTPQIIVSEPEEAVNCDMYGASRR